MGLYRLRLETEGDIKSFSERPPLLIEPLLSSALKSSDDGEPDASCRRDGAFDRHP